ncbi:MAG: response regulator [Candidatus Heimdallarchaeota archaeon]|nr:response regulator [Candidatus Heimdallarchaeota archaeon]
MIDPSLVFDALKAKPFNQREMRLYRIYLFFTIIMAIAYFTFHNLIDHPDLHIKFNFHDLIEIVFVLNLVIAFIILKKEKYDESRHLTFVTINLGFFLFAVFNQNDESIVFNYYFLLAFVISVYFYNIIISSVVYFINMLVFLLIQIVSGNFNQERMLKSFPMVFLLNIVLITFVFYSSWNREDLLSRSNKVENYLKKIYDNIPFGIALGTLEGNVIDGNSIFFKLLEYEKHELIGINMSDFSHPDDIDATIENMKKILTGKEQFFDMHKRFITKGNNVLWTNVVASVVNERGKPRYILATLRDISDLKEMEEKERNERELLEQSQRVEMIGLLASSIAHDFNNIMAIVNGYAEMLKTSNLSRDQEEMVNEISNAGSRATSMTRQLLSFSKKQDSMFYMHNINDIILEIENFMQMSINIKDVRLTFELDKSIEPILCDKNKLQQVFMNLINNAVEAFDSNGTIIVSTKNLKESILISVLDDGPGIPQDFREKIFDPYFTTKSDSGGTGLGLTIVHNIIMEHSGKIEVSDGIKGTEFKINLPKISPRSRHERIQNYMNFDLNKISSCKILLVEDEESISNLTKKYLTELNIEVAVFNDPFAALEFYEQEQNYQILITDIRMPKLSGLKLAEKILEINPKQQILFITGFGDQILKNQSEKLATRPLLQKPFTKYELIKQIHIIMEHCK